MKGRSIRLMLAASVMQLTDQLSAFAEAASATARRFQSIGEAVPPELRRAMKCRRAAMARPVGQRGYSLTPLERRAVIMGSWRPRRKARHRPSRLFKGHRP